MYKLIRFYNQNRKKIFKIILIIVLIIAIIQLLNYFAKNKTKEKTEENSNTISNINNQQELLSNKSAISGENVPETKLKNDSNVIEEFFKYCNEQNIDSAYGMLTDECKEEMFPTIEDFNSIYYSKIFNGDKKSYTVENWIGDIYQVTITGDILSTGKLDNSETKQDYITVVKNNKEYKLNINNYVGRKITNKTTEYKDIKVTIQSIDTFMDYEIYNLSIENNTGNTILLDKGDSTKSIYLLDSKDIKYYFYSNEIIQNRLIIQNGFKSNLQIKFSNSYSSSRNIKSLVFSNMILNYEEYNKLDDKSQYKDFYVFNVKV